MKPDAQREAALLEAAAKVSGRERAMFLEGACHGDPALRARLDALLAAHEQTGLLQCRRGLCWDSPGNCWRSVEAEAPFAAFRSKAGQAT